MYEPKIKGYFAGFLVFSILLLWFLFSEIEKIPESNPANWEECEGHVVEEIDNRTIYSYQENGNFHHYYYLRQYLPGTEAEASNTIKLFYYKENPEKVVEEIMGSYTVITVMVMVGLFAMLFIGMTVFMYRYMTIPKKGMRVKLKIQDSIHDSNGGMGMVYRFMWQKDNKIKYLTDPYRTCAYKEIIDLCGITEVYCYVRNDKSRYCYADFEGTFEENNISLSMTKRGTDLK